MNSLGSLIVYFMGWIRSFQAASLRVTEFLGAVKGFDDEYTGHFLMNTLVFWVGLPAANIFEDCFLFQYYCTCTDSKVLFPFWSICSDMKLMMKFSNSLRNHNRVSTWVCGLNLALMWILRVLFLCFQQKHFRGLFVDLTASHVMKISGQGSHCFLARSGENEQHCVILTLGCFMVKIWGSTTHGECSDVTFKMQIAPLHEVIKIEINT